MRIEASPSRRRESEVRKLTLMAFCCVVLGGCETNPDAPPRPYVPFVIPPVVFTPIKSPPRPVTTDCTTNGNQTHCVSR